MGIKGLELVETTYRVSDDTLYDPGPYNALTMPDLVSSYRDILATQLTPKDFTRVSDLHYDITETFVVDALDTLSQNTTRSATEYQVAKATKVFQETVEGISRLGYTPDKMTKLIVKIIDYSLLKDGVSQHVTDEAASIVRNLGNSSEIIDAKIKRISDIHDVAAKKAEARAADELVKARALRAENMLKHMGVTVIKVVKPSIKAATVEYGKVHAKGIAVKATIAAVAMSVMAPSVANASEPTPPSSPALQGTSPNNKGGVGVALPGEQSKNDPKPITLSDSPQPEATAPVEAPVQVSSGTAYEKNTGSKKPNSDPSTAPTPGTSATPVTSVTAPPVEASPQTISLAPDVNTDTQTPMQEVTVAPPVEAPVPNINDQSPVAPDVPAPVTAPVVLTPEAPATQPSPNQEQLTPKQTAAQDISDQLNSDGNIANASQRLVDNFGIKASTDSAVANSATAIPTPNLLANVKTLEGSYMELIQATGHADVNYINTSLMALAVLDASSNDQIVLKSKEVTDLIADAKRPDDPYLARLYDQYLDIAKKTLNDPSTKLLDGIDPTNVQQVEALYAYALMADTTDLDQSAKIQAMKDADAKAAAEKAAADKAAADKAAADKAAADASGETSMSPNQILQAAISQAAAKFGWSNNKTILLTVAAQNGASAAAIAGLGGNVFAESGFDPGKEERGSGIGFGYIQESYGRRKAMEAAALADGANVADPTWQANYVIKESKQRSQRNNAHKNEWAEFITITDPTAAADYWLYNNERAGVPHSATREAMASEIYNQINGEYQSIQAAQAAAAEKAKEAAAAEAERQAKMGMNLEEAKAFVASYKSSPDSINYIGRSGTDCKGGPLSNCVSFSVYFINKYTSLGGMVKLLPGNGSTVVQNVANRNSGLKTGHTPMPFSVFSTPSGTQMCGPVKCGHTGVILGVDAARGKVIVGEAACGAGALWDTAREYDLSKFDSDAYTYAYTEDFLNGPVK